MATPRKCAVVAGARVFVSRALLTRHPELLDGFDVTVAEQRQTPNELARRFRQPLAWAGVPTTLLVEGLEGEEVVVVGAACTDEGAATAAQSTLEDLVVLCGGETTFEEVADDVPSSRELCLR